MVICSECKQPLPEDRTEMYYRCNKCGADRMSGLKCPECESGSSTLKRRKPESVEEVEEEA